MANKMMVFRLSTPMKQVWWANQPYPPFEVQLVDPEGGFDASTISGWKVAVALVDQNQRWFPLSEYGITRGKVTISGIRFPLSAHKTEAVCRLAICLSHPNAATSIVQRFVSEPVRIVSMQCAPQAAKAQPPALTEVKPAEETSSLSAQEEQMLRSMPLALRFVEPVESLWYADRHFPRFEVEVYRTDTKEVVPLASGWRVGLTVVDGNGQETLEVIHDHERFLNHPHVFRDGRVSIGGVRFSRVSSKCGGFFRLVVAVVKPGPFLMVVSDKIQILSYRLYHAPKVPLEKLGPNDSLSKMKGIGSLYAKRFAALGTVTIAQLASVKLEAMTDAQRTALLDSLRKERGGLTVAKLQTYVDQARQIVFRYHNPGVPVPVPAASQASVRRIASHAPNTPPRRGSTDSRCSNSPPASPVNSLDGAPEVYAPKLDVPSPRRSLKRALSNELSGLEELFGGEEGLMCMGGDGNKRPKPSPSTLVRV